VPEKLALHERAHQRAAIDRHEMTAGRAVEQLSCGNFLAGSTLSLDQDRSAAGAQLFQLTPDLHNTMRASEKSHNGEVVPKREKKFSGNLPPPGGVTGLSLYGRAQLDEAPRSRIQPHAKACGKFTPAGAAAPSVSAAFGRRFPPSQHAPEWRISLTEYLSCRPVLRRHALLQAVGIPAILKCPHLHRELRRRRASPVTKEPSIPTGPKPGPISSNHLRRRMGKVDDTAAHERSPVDNPHIDCLAVVQIAHPHHGLERQLRCAATRVSMS